MKFSDSTLLPVHIYPCEIFGTLLHVEQEVISSYFVIRFNYTNWWSFKKKKVNLKYFMY